MTDNNLILYTTEDGAAHFMLREMGGNIWLSQSEMSELYQVTPQAITQHIKAVYEESELSPKATCKENLQVQNEGKRQIKRIIKHYSLPVILAVGYRVRSPRGTQFRQWATSTLSEYMVKGFVMDDERLKDPKWDYFDELLERIRDIRSSEKRFYQKVRELFTLTEDYRAHEEETKLFFAEVQNKMFFAVTGHTAAELIVRRANPNEANMGLTSWKGKWVRKEDIVVAKNYLQANELEHLNRIVTMFLEFAELRAKQKQHLYLEDWRQYVNSFMEFNEQSLLKHAGKVSHEQMKEITRQRYEKFDGKRKADEALREDVQELAMLDQIERKLKNKEEIS